MAQSTSQSSLKRDALPNSITCSSLSLRAQTVSVAPSSVAHDKLLRHVSDTTFSSAFTVADSIVSVDRMRRRERKRVRLCTVGNHRLHGIIALKADKVFHNLNRGD